MRKTEAKSILKHIKKDSKEFRSQLVEDKKLATSLKKSLKGGASHGKGTKKGNR